MKRILIWFEKWIKFICILIVLFFAIGLIGMFVFMATEPLPKTAYTTRADCSRAMVKHDKELTEAKQEAQDWEDSYKELALNYKKIARGICFRTEKEKKDVREGQ